MLGARMTVEDIAARYRRFGCVEVGESSPLWRDLACGIAAAPDLVAFISTLPPGKRQPNLVMATARTLLGHVPTVTELQDLSSDPRWRTEILHRRTQTNEPARCAVLLPLLAQLPQPLALLEIGAAAGLYLFPDHYAYDYGQGRIGVSDPAAPVFPCAITGGLSPSQLPRIAWRGGLDLAPLDPGAKDVRDWLHALVWPQQESRAENLNKALDVAAGQPRIVRQGDAEDSTLEALATEARREAPGATLVIFHTAVLAYLPDADRRRAVADRCATLSDLWICNEGPGVVPWLAAGQQAVNAADFLICANGAPFAWADPHGGRLDLVSSRPFV